jgi:hypothetical protein
VQEEEIQNHAWTVFEEAVKLITFDENRRMFGRVKEYLDRRKDG